MSLCKNPINVPVLQVSDVDGLPWSPAQSPLLPTPDSSQDLCPGCPGTCPMRVLLMTATTLRDQIEIAEHSARRTLCTVFFCSATIPYCHTPRGQSFLCSLSGHQPHTAHRVCSSVSGSLGDISWYFHPPSPKGTPRSPCNPSHSCRFDTFLYNCNTSSGKNFCPVKSWNVKIWHITDVEYEDNVIPSYWF